MPAGLPYFAWIDPGEATFGPEHLRWDEQVFSFELKQDEGDPASLTVVVRRPRNVAGDPIGLLGPGRKIWCWFAFDCGPDLIRCRGRLVGVPTSLFEELVTLDFVARPIDLVAQKAALADSLRVLPYYDEVVIDEARRTDPEVVLEGYSAIWHYDRETHVLSVSDEIDGEDGLVEFDGTSEDGKVFYDGLGLTLTSGPLARVDVSAEYTWTQQARGNVDLTGYLVGNWPNEAGYAIAGHISSFTFTADSWPQAGAGIGDGWEVAEATAIPHDDLTVVSTTRQTEGKINWWDGSSTSTTFSESISAVASGVPLGSITFPGIVTQDSVSVSYGGGGEDSEKSLSGTSRSFAATLSFLPLYHSRTTLTAAYTANRQCTEKVTFSLYADVQPILTDPDDGEALQIADVKSANLSEPLSGGDVPIGDPRRRSYIATERGNRSLEHLIALARANLLKRARVVEIAFAPKLARMPEITLRKNAFLAEPRVGEAVGKIIGYSLALDGADGQVKCEVRIGCAIGRGGAVAAVAGEPTYCTVDYAGADYQQFTGRVVLLDPADTSVGYEPPASDPNDDGIEFASPLTAADVIDTPLSVENPPAAQRAHIMALMPTWDIFARIGNGQQNVGERDQAVKSALDAVPTKATFKLKSMTRDFSTDYQITLTDLKIPTGYDLEAS